MSNPDHPSDPSGATTETAIGPGDTTHLVNAPDGRALAASTVSNDNERAPQADPAKPRRPRLQTRPTVRLDPKDLRPSWPLVLAYLEQLAPWPVLALRLGTLALIQASVRELAEPNASADLVVKLRDLVEALAHMPLEA